MLFDFVYVLGDSIFGVNSQYYSFSPFL